MAIDVNLRAADVAVIALQHRQHGDYALAEEEFEAAYRLSTNSSERVDILINWADTVRRWPERTQEAWELLERAMGEFAACGSTGKVVVIPLPPVAKQYAAILHHMGRLARQEGDYFLACSLISQALVQLELAPRLRLKQSWRPIDEVMVRLDLAASLALKGSTSLSRRYAISALLHMLHAPHWQNQLLNRSHVFRGLTILVFATRAHSTRSPRIRRAFFGRTFPA